MHLLSPPGADIPCFAFAANKALDRSHRSARSRTQANKVKLRRSTGATGHDEGNEILIRSAHSCTRAPSLSKRSCQFSVQNTHPYTPLEKGRKALLERLRQGMEGIAVNPDHPAAPPPDDTRHGRPFLEEPHQAIAV